MAAEEQSTRYILTLLAEGGWPDESRVPTPVEMQREAGTIFDKPIEIRSSDATQNPGAHVQRYYEVQADPSLTPMEITDMLVVVIERIGASTFSGLEVEVLLANSVGTAVARGTARPQPR